MLRLLQVIMDLRVTAEIKKRLTELSRRLNLSPDDSIRLLLNHFEMWDTLLTAPLTEEFCDTLEERVKEHAFLFNQDI